MNLISLSPKLYSNNPATKKPMKAKSTPAGDGAPIAASGLQRFQQLQDNEQTGQQEAGQGEYSPFSQNLQKIVMQVGIDLFSLRMAVAFFVVRQ